MPSTKIVDEFSAEPTERSREKSVAGEVAVPQLSEGLVHELAVFGSKINVIFFERFNDTLDSGFKKRHGGGQLTAQHQSRLWRPITSVKRLHRILKRGLNVISNRCRHDSSLAGYGADLVSAPMATTEGATSVVGDIVRDGSDITPEAHDTSVESSPATGAAQPTPGPHPKPSTESGSDQR